MAKTIKRGLFRLSLIFMILWNLFCMGFVLKEINAARYLAVSGAMDDETTCIKSKPYHVCHAEYQAALHDYSLWRALKRVFSVEAIAYVELFPPVAIALVWGVLWGLFATGKWVLQGFDIEFKNRQGSYTVVMAQTFRGIGKWAVTPSNLLALSVGVVALAVAYYYLVSLPAANRERLQFQKETAAAAKAELETKEEHREYLLLTCEADAENSYWSYVKLNGKEDPNKRNTYIATTLIWDMASKQKADALAECHRQFDAKK